jgi:hypothetical protein
VAGAHAARQFGPGQLLLLHVLLQLERDNALDGNGLGLGK